MLLVVAYGNPLRRDDGVGWRVAGALGQADGVEVACVQQLVPELARQLARASGVLFLDAALDGRPGQVAVRDIVPARQDSALGHVLDPAGLLAFTRQLEGRAPPAEVLTVTALDIGFGGELSAPVARALGEAAEAARSALARLRQRKACGPASSNP